MAKRRSRATRPTSTGKHVLSAAQLAALDEACEVAPKIASLATDVEVVKAAIKTIRLTIAEYFKNHRNKAELELPLLVYSYFTQDWLPNYATVDFDHIVGLHDVLQSIKKYINDKSLKRPLNFLLLASPGSGKSHLIKSIAQHLRDQDEKISDVTFNMATMRSKNDLGQVLDHARNIAIEGRLPLLFLDEFDSDAKNYSLLLPLLWDGSLDVGHRDLRLGRSIFFLAGSRKELPEKLELARNVSDPRSASQENTKLLDLFSRINGTVIQLPILSDVTQNHVTQKHIPDKFVIAMSLLRYRFKKCIRVPVSLLWFIVKAQFRYDARSIATFINNIPLANGEDADTLPELTRRHIQGLPMSSREVLLKSALAFHLVDGNHADGLIEQWEVAMRVPGTQLLQFPPIGKPPVPPDWYRQALILQAEKSTAKVWPAGI